MNIPQPPLQGPIIGTVPVLPAWATFFQQLAQYLGGIPLYGELPNYLNDAAAAAGGVPLYGYYRNGSVVMQRVV